MMPEGWKDRTLKEIADIFSGVGFPRKHQGSQVGKIPFFKVSDMNAPGNERGLRVAANTVDRAVLDSLKGKLHPPGTVVFPKVGAALLTNKRRRLVVPSCFDNNVMGLVATGCDPDYLYLLMQAVDFADHVQSGALPSINGSMVGGIRVLVPTLREQRKIAAILSSVDDAIEKTQAVIDQVQVVKRGLMQELLTRGLPGRHTRFKQTEVGEIPEEWEIRPLIEACTSKGQYGANAAKSDFRLGGIRYVRITDINEDGTLRNPAVGIRGEEATDYLLRDGDVLFARSGATVGKVYLHREFGIRCAFAGYLIRFRTDRNILLPAFLREYVDTPTYWRWVADRQRTQAQPNINATEYGQLPIPCPPLDEQRRAIEIAESFTTSLQVTRKEVVDKSRLREALMSVLLTGELRVTPDTEVA